MFHLHERLAADTVPLAEWPLCRVLLMNDAGYPWLILVPARPGICEIHELSAPDRRQLMAEIAAAAQQLQQAVQAHKINVAALGNVVAQLHVHVVARFRDDPAWPRPVWGAVPARPYTPEELRAQRELLHPLFRSNTQFGV